MEQQKESAELYPLLSKIESPKDLKVLSTEQMEELSKEIRTFLIDKVMENGGHLASNLGVVELSLAIHRVFDSPNDHIIFDVGHQSYIHKLITGRMQAFDTLRRGGGMSGFPKRSESEHDCFGTGHSSTSLSAALGFAEADHLAGSDAYTVCVLGDGAYTGGMIHEALNNCKKKLRLIIIINENEMSISKNIGRFAKSLSRLRTSKGYFKTKSATTSLIYKIPLIGKPIYSLLRRVKVAFKSALYGSNYFENLGLYYLGPVDGNDEATVERLLQEAKESSRSCVLHVKTQKGKGYAPAEETPSAFHGVAPADKKLETKNNFSAEMGQILTELASENEKICAITAAMADGTGLVEFREKYPSRFFDVGIAEEHAVTFAAGLAANRYRPVVALYSTFLQRAYDNIIHDVALQNLPVVFCVDRAGLNASDGATHHGIFDVAFLSEIPNLDLYTPITYNGLRVSIKQALSSNRAAAIRYPNGYEDEKILSAFYGEDLPEDIHVRHDYVAAETLDAVIITHGRIVKEAMKSKEILAKQGIFVGILLLEQLKPYETVAKEVSALLPKKDCKVLFLEEEIKAGGMGMMLSDALSKDPVMNNKTCIFLATDDQFAIQDKDEPIWKTVGIDAGSIVAALI